MPIINCYVQGDSLTELNYFRELAINGKSEQLPRPLNKGDCSIEAKFTLWEADFGKLMGKRLIEGDHLTEGGLIEV